MSKGENNRGSGAQEHMNAGERQGSTEGKSSQPGSANARSRPLKVALACPGVGLEQRGFERLFYDLFHLVKDDLDVTLYKGGGVRNQREVVLKFANRNGWIARYFPVHKLAGRTEVHLEDLTFAIALLYAIRKENVDIIHVIDPALTRFLFNVRNRFKLNFRIFYTEGCAMPPGHYPPADHVQQIALPTFEEAVQYGWPRDYMTLLPAGIYPESFEVETSKSELRASYGVDQDTFVILGIAAINRGHKRVDHLINEVARLDGDVLLWVDGSMDQGEPDLIDYARDKLGDRCRITHVETEQVGDLLKMADLFVHAAMKESFGLSIVEAAATGLPLLIHDSEHFQWLVPNPECSVDMAEEGALAQRIQKLLGDRDGLSRLRARDQVRAKFDWKLIKADYLALYRKVAELPMKQSES